MSTKMSTCLHVQPVGSREEDVRSVSREVRSLPLDSLKEGHVRVAVKYSSLNFKDALCATGHPGVARTLPIIPGIDAAGEVVQSSSDTFAEGDRVMIFHADFGTKSNGGYSQFVDVPTEWVFRIPDSLSERDAMIVGTAGFTSAQCIDELQKHGVEPDGGEVVVSGATGGVGIFALMLLAKLGYTVVASTGKSDKADWLRSLGAADVIGRDQVNDQSERELLKGRWAGAVDTVGGNTLATILRSTVPHGCVTACGLVGGTNFGISVYPFILRGITLQGIDTATISPDYRAKLWSRIATDWQIESLGDIAIEVDLNGLEEKIEQILAGQIAGRVIVRVGAEN